MKFDDLVGWLGSDLREYLGDRGFYSSSMDPRFLDGKGYDELTIGLSCARSDIDINNNLLRIFINKVDIYFEVQSGYGSLLLSDRYDPSKFTELEDYIEVLDDIANRVASI